MYEIFRLNRVSKKVIFNKKNKSGLSEDKLTGMESDKPIGRSLKF